MKYVKLSRIDEHCKLNNGDYNDATITRGIERGSGLSPEIHNESAASCLAKLDDDMLEEYDFTNGVRGKYADKYFRETNVVVLEPDIAKLFPNSEAVNQALRSLHAIQSIKTEPTGTT